MLAFANADGRVPCGLMSGTPIHSYDEIPFIVALFVVRNQSQSHMEVAHCGGTLIATDWVITAAHCITPLSVVDPSKARVCHNILDPTIDKCKSYGKFVAVHPQYKERQLFANDLAMIKISPIETPVAKLPLLIAGSSLRGKYMTFTGWGNSTLITKTELLIGNQCHNDLSLCTSSDENKGIICRGDSGGGLFYKKNTLVGVASLGHSTCIDVNAMTNFVVFVSVDKYLMW
ncbi:PREDICTED: granzyme M, partial [Nicrophorus vespilloides]|uniref:Granzyme M n=1 Tax=Nicrophorus vespilloides TaxID=110193 RepID=A0ABM1MPA6_NICVS